MSKLGCPCGGTIVDQRPPLPNGGWVLCDEDEESFLSFTQRVAEFVAAVTAGQREQWVQDWYGRAMPDLRDNSVVADIMLASLVPRHLRLYQCERCGRLHLQAGKDASVFRSFRPDAAWQGSLREATVVRNAV